MACPTGIAHTVMAAEALERTAKVMGHTLRAKMRGSVGAKNVLTAQEIAEADTVIIASDIHINKETEPALFERIHPVALPGDFIRGKLLGGCDCATDPTNAFGTGLFNTRLGRWHENIVATLGLPREILPAVLGSRSARGSRERFGGRTESQDVGHQTRAVMEGVMLDLFRLRPPIFENGPGFMVGAGKGLQNSRVWAQMAADIFACPLKISNCENAVWGAALIAALGSGAVPHVHDALRTIEYDREFAPDPGHASEYQDLIAERKSRWSSWL